MRETIAHQLFHESDTYQAILEEGYEMATREHILIVGEERFGAPEEVVKIQLSKVTELNRLRRMFRYALKVANWQQVLETP